ncbi:UDP-N-acetylmuramoylalanyl-D-glutamate--2,6-diaminopimelate ligase [Enhygromyxa salina]|uniref:UDP-N-acetylmuramoyl-L-alanyl-D-glutamate--2,6-diaminopimelate ligase n=1 Tax=Enhygromyxa salina TaxID=215803 RepID=A0A0C2D7Z3_9BACT|nr:UDP-N-acetylmuramoyl-L-alanyl-D-glutamate--2,6-diaminopimelate ligase [Enhygromyxa salina]KIG16122.1 UDP-N-acetylmuramoylalanyl-D-glutamate--2,6-diaminopimelate ligase [Enhygromyxa salina]
MTRGSPLRRVGELLAALDPALHARAIGCDPDTLVGSPKVDSRAIEPGDCFIATAGHTVDGHDFIDKAVAAGATLVVVRRDRGISGSQPRIVVDDVAAALPSLAAGWYGWPGERLQLAGITGTNGKTSTAHLVASVLQAAGHPHLRLGTTGDWIVDHETPASFTTPFPIDLQRLLATACERGATHGVMEVSSHGLDQGRIVPLQFAAVALTSFSQDHLDYHASMAAYLQAKCLLARRHCLASGVAVAPAEGEAGSAFLQAAAEAGVERRWRSSRVPVSERAAEICVIERDHAAAGLVARLRTPVGSLWLRSPLVGDFNLDNLMAAVGLSIGLGVELPHIEAALGQARGAPGRLEAVALPSPRGDDHQGPAVYVDYAHTPDAVARAIEALRPTAAKRGGKLVILLGCGGDRDASKRPIMGEVASRGADRFIATSDNPRTEDPEAILSQMLAGAIPQQQGGAELIREVDRARAISLAISEANAHDVVLLAGKGHENYQVLGTTKIHFDDREQAELALRARTRPGSPTDPRGV